MNYQKWADEAKDKLKKMTDTELRSLALGEDVDVAKIAGQILLERQDTTGRNNARICHESRR